MRERAGRIHKGFIFPVIRKMVITIRLIIKNSFIVESNTCNNPAITRNTVLSLLNQFSSLDFLLSYQWRTTFIKGWDLGEHTE